MKRTFRTRKTLYNYFGIFIHQYAHMECFFCGAKIRGGREDFRFTNNDLRFGALCLGSNSSNYRAVRCTSASVQLPSRCKFRNKRGSHSSIVMLLSFYVELCIWSAWAIAHLTSLRTADQAVQP
jgi:hypothetical protein